MKRPEYMKLYEQARQLEVERQWLQACEIYNTIIDHVPAFLQAYRRRSECLMRLQRWAEAETDVETIFSSDTKIVNRDIKRRVTIFCRKGESDKATETIADFARQWRKDNQDQTSHGSLILIAAAPKTGSTSMSLALAEATGWSRTNFLCYMNSPLGAGIPSLAALEHLKGIGLINHCHLAADKETLKALAKMPWVKIVVQFRNPAETLLSTIDMMVRDRNPLICSYLPKDQEMSGTALIDWGIKVYLPLLTRWVEKWVIAIDSDHPSIIGWTTLDEMKTEGQDAVAREFLRTAGFGPVKTVTTEPQRTGQRLQGHEKVQYSKRQEEQVLDQISQHLRERFGW